MASLNWWYLTDLARLKQEREGFAALAARENWLTLGGWRFDKDGCLLIDCDIDIGHRVYEAVLRYPESYPHSPPAVRPRDGEARWSIHQYGDGGDLCLEYRPDNWSPELMGWQLVDSAHRLLQGENPKPNERARVASAHRATEGQRLRSAFNRLPLTRTLVTQLATLPEGGGVRGNSVVLFTEANIMRMITGFTLPNGDVWTDSEVPSALASEAWSTPVYIRRLTADEIVPPTSSYEAFAAAAAPLGWESTDRVFLALVNDQVHAIYSHDDYVRALTVVPPATAALRTSDDYRQLTSMRIGVLGCGSVGSKIAAILARAGVRFFDLIDDDILMSDNLVRHELDWRDVGLHKVAALARRLQCIRADIEVRTRCQQLAGQESATSAENILTRLAECDLIVDATAEPAVRNVLSGLSLSTGIPLVWAEVFPGGIGGLIARHRPGLEPAVPLMCRAIDNWFADQGVSPSVPAANYELVGEGAPVIADDADVTTIAAHAARLAIDTLLRRDPSYFHSSIYVIGLAPSEIFTQAFDTRPIALPPPPPEPARPVLSPEAEGEQLAFLGQLIDHASEGA